MWILVKPGTSYWLDLNVYVPTIDKNVSWKYNFPCSENGTEQTIGDSWRDNWELMTHFLNGCSNILWCDCSNFWLCSEFIILHHSDYLCKIFTNVFMSWTRLHHHRYKLNRIASMVIAISQYQPLTRAIFSRPKICGNILNIF